MVYLNKHQTPSKHLRHRGCPKCGGTFKLNNDKFIKESTKIHGNKYDYLLVNYKNNRENVQIICPDHGIFEQSYKLHVDQKHGCPKCNGGILSNKEEFISKSKNIHGDKYDYSLVNYKNGRTKVKIICKKHDIFEQTPDAHIQGQGCPICNNKKVTLENFIIKSNKIHNNKFDYSIVILKNTATKVKIICPKHGVFEQRPNDHLQGSGCILCRNDNKRKPLKEFIISSNQIHNNKYNYTLVKYKNNKSKIKIICPIHGVFEQILINHLIGQGCPKCNESKGEKEIKEILESNNIIFEIQKKFKNCINIKPLPFDFYLPKYNTCIEYDGKQHFEPIDFFGGEKGLQERIKRDEIKTNYCNNKNIKLIRIPYSKFDDIENILIKNLKIKQ